MVEYSNGMRADAIVGAWTKARASLSDGQCAEVISLPGGLVAMRQSTDPAGPALVFTPAEFRAFITGAKAGDFDHVVQ